MSSTLTAESSPITHHAEYGYDDEWLSIMDLELGKPSMPREDLQRWFDIQHSRGFPDLFMLGAVVNDCQNDVVLPSWYRIVDLYASRIKVTENMCQKCHMLLCSVAINTQQPGQVRLSTMYVQAGAQLGCNLCRLLRETLLAKGLFHAIQRLEQRFLWLDGAADLLGLSYHSLSQPNDLNINFSMSFRQMVANLLVFRTAYGQHSKSSTDALRSANVWMQTCINSHQCANAYQDLKLPTRLLSLKEPLRIVETDSCDMKPEYATLSYCWGKGNSMKLTTATYEAFMHRIPYEKMPRTYHDAIKVARSFKIEWLWIDALCILQDEDDHLDFLRESAIMGDIYGGSAITLAASTSADVAEGALTVSSDFIAGFNTHLTGAPARVYFDWWPGAVTRSVLSRRGWAFQERLLSPRTLYLTSYGIFYECLEMNASEHDPQVVVASRSKDELCLARSRAWDWQRLISAYSIARLSFPQDRLVAISGLAKCQERLTNDQYIAGMWKGDLLWQLTWLAYKEGTRTERNAPTWSWISTSAPVRWRNHEFRTPLATVLSTEVDLINPSDSFGRIASGRLKLACPGLIPLKQLHASRDVSLDCGKDDLLQDEQDYYALPLIQYSTSDASDRWLDALILQSCCTHSFRRIGKWSPNEWSGGFDQALRLLADVGRDTAAAICRETTPDGRFIVTII